MYNFPHLSSSTIVRSTRTSLGSGTVRYRRYNFPRLSDCIMMTQLICIRLSFTVLVETTMNRQHDNTRPGPGKSSGEGDYANAIKRSITVGGAYAPPTQAARSKKTKTCDASDPLITAGDGCPPPSVAVASQHINISEHPLPYHPQ